uniref:Mediator of RNA polymerase II transcription subunit 15 n=1 Tax=Petromyzon marinus TaxID=7757 RepID=S4R8E8_PETMA
MDMGESDWRSQAFRQKVVVQIEEAVRQAGHPITKSSKEMENHVFMKASSRDEYMALLARLILHIRDYSKKARPNQGDPMHALQVIAPLGPGQPGPPMMVPRPQVPGGPMHRMPVPQPQGQPNQGGPQPGNMGQPGHTHSIASRSCQFTAIQQMCIATPPGQPGMQAAQIQQQQQQQMQMQKQLIQQVQTKVFDFCWSLAICPSTYSCHYTRTHVYNKRFWVRSCSGELPAQAQIRAIQVKPYFVQGDVMSPSRVGNKSLPHVLIFPIRLQLAPNPQVCTELLSTVALGLQKQPMWEIQACMKKDQSTRQAPVPHLLAITSNSVSFILPTIDIANMEMVLFTVGMMSSPSPVPAQNQVMPPPPSQPQPSPQSTQSQPPSNMRYRRGGSCRTLQALCVFCSRETSICIVIARFEQTYSKLSAVDLMVHILMVGTLKSGENFIKQTEQFVCNHKRHDKVIRSLSNLVTKTDRKKDLSKMKSLLDILTDPNKRCSLQTLQKCELALEKLKSDMAVPTPPPPQVVPPNKQAPLCQPLLTAVLQQSRSPLFNHSLARTFGPAMLAIHGPPVSVPVSSPKKRKYEEDEKQTIPNVLQGEVARLHPKFMVNLDPSHHSNNGTVHLICKLEDKSLPMVPPLQISVPADYPDQSPEWVDLQNLYEASPFLRAIHDMLESRIMKLPDRHAVTAILNAWALSVRQACLTLT